MTELDIALMRIFDCGSWRINNGHLMMMDLCHCRQVIMKAPYDAKNLRKYATWEIPPNSRGSKYLHPFRPVAVGTFDLDMTIEILQVFKAIGARSFTIRLKEDQVYNGPSGLLEFVVAPFQIREDPEGGWPIVDNIRIVLAGITMTDLEMREAKNTVPDWVTEFNGPDEGIAFWFCREEKVSRCLARNGEYER